MTNSTFTLEFFTTHYDYMEEIFHNDSHPEIPYQCFYDDFLKESGLISDKDKEEWFASFKEDDEEIEECEEITDFDSLLDSPAYDYLSEDITGWAISEFSKAKDAWIPYLYNFICENNCWSEETIESIIKEITTK